MINDSANAAVAATRAAAAAAASAAATSVLAGPNTATAIMISSATASLSQITLDPSYIMQLAEKEYDNIQINKKSSKPREDTGVALSVQQNSGHNGKGKGKEYREKHLKGVCWNCGGRGHVQKNCLSPKHLKEGADKGNSAGTSGSANIMDCCDDDGAWAAIGSLIPVPLGLQLGAGTIFDIASLFDL